MNIHLELENVSGEGTQISEIYLEPKFSLIPAKNIYQDCLAHRVRTMYILTWICIKTVLHDLLAQVSIS